MTCKHKSFLTIYFYSLIFCITFFIIIYIAGIIIGSFIIIRDKSDSYDYNIDKINCVYKNKTLICIEPHPFQQICHPIPFQKEITNITLLCYYLKGKLDTFTLNKTDLLEGKLLNGQIKIIFLRIFILCLFACFGLLIISGLFWLILRITFLRQNPFLRTYII